ncbi:Prefoldin subunit family protein [Babesia bovis T2Bo]|uniref:Prefoldin subunit 6, putative n=1 Tax=Babesia bovis TaxID=5865 RepID=A7AQM2_BABBO|nr:Prefoldin subunit family protein [Babesia bovis T2Bo]EDO06841.1 Prefoldin subunit family protein [Babesia bovis T2Bo]|eukprot:XP_001610409.1 prefoldin subunit 6 [Babesia bovis T2Bo]
MDAIVAKVNNLRQQYRDVAAAHSQLLTQHNECTAELQLVESDAKIYKSTGPVLTTQSKEDAIHTISKRIEYISSEIEEKTKLMSTLQESIESECKTLDNMGAQRAPNITGD